MKRNVKITFKRPYLNSIKRDFILIGVITFLYLSCWALITPPGGSGDDYYHLPSIWCSDKLASDKSCILQDGKYYVPSTLAFENVTCWVSWGDRLPNATQQSAKCINDYNETSFGFSTYLNQKNHLYPPLFYNLSSLFVFSNIELSIICIRLFWALLFAIIFSNIFLTINKYKKPHFLFYNLLLLIPLGSYIIPSSNPSSGAIIGLFALPYYLNFFIFSKDRFKQHLMKLMLVAIIAGFSRADAAIICVLILVVGTLLWKTAVTISKLLPILSVMFLMCIPFITSIQTRTLIKDGLTSRLHPNEFVGLNLFAKNFARQFEYYSGFWGYYWGLGWRFEPPIPLVVPLFLAIIFLFYFMILSNTISEKFPKILILGFSYLSVLVPILVLTYSNQEVGMVVQPRYGYPFLLSGLGLMLMNVDIVKVDQLKVKFLSNLSIKISLFVWQIATSFIFLLQLSRVTNGLPIRYKAQPEWWWSFYAISPNLLFLTFLLINGLIFRYVIKIYKESVNS